MAVIGKRTIEFLLEAKDRTKKVLSSAQKNIEKFHKSVAGLASSLGIVFAGGGIIAGIKSMATEMDDLGKVATKLGTTTEELSKLRYAALLTGVSSNLINTSLQRMVRVISEAADESGGAQESLEELGLVAAELNKLTLDEKFKTIAEAMGDIKPQADKVRLSYDLFDSSGVDLLNTLALGREGLERYGEELERIGAVVTKDGSDAAAKFVDMLTQLQGRINGLTQSIAQHLLPNWTEWYELLINGTPLELLGETELVNKEIQRTAYAIASVKTEMEELDAWRATHDFLLGNTQGLDRQLDTLRGTLRDHQARMAEIIDKSAAARAQARAEEKERAHNRAMTDARDEELAALKEALKAKEGEFKRHETALGASRDRQVVLLKSISDAIDEFSDYGNESEVPDRADTVDAVAAVWDNINAGDTAAAKAALESLIEMFRAYQEAGKASKADVVTMVAQLEALGEATNHIEGKGLEEAAVRAAAAHQDLQDEIEGKPIKAPVDAADDAGEKVWIGTQNQVNAKGPIKISAEIGLVWGAIVPPPATQSDVQYQSIKKGIRI